jgi:hypothetical protein
VAAKESLSILENLMLIGVYLNPKFETRIQEWLGDLEGKD